MGRDVRGDLEALRQLYSVGGAAQLSPGELPDIAEWWIDSNDKVSVSGTGLVSVGMKANYVSDFNGRGGATLCKRGLGLLTVWMVCKALLILGLYSLYRGLIIKADLSIEELVTLCPHLSGR